MPVTAPRYLLDTNVIIALMKDNTRVTRRIQDAVRCGPQRSPTAIARAHDLTLVTRNVREFERVPGLRLENWETS